MAFRLRQAGPGDGSILTDFRVKLFEEIGYAPASHAATAFESACLETVTGYLKEEKAFAWIAESDEGAPVGTLILLLHARLPSPRLPGPTEGYILNVFVEQAWRRQGIAAALMNAALERARALGLERIRLHTTPAGRATYTRSGFVPREDEMETVLKR